MRFNLQSFAKTFGLFAVTQLLGIYVAVKILPEMSVGAAGISSFSYWDILYLAILFFIFFFLSVKFPRFGSAVYRIFLTLIIFAAFQTFLSFWFNAYISFFVPILLLIVFWLKQTVFIQDAVMIVSLAAIGAIFGLSLTPLTVVYVLIIFSIYDLVAVYVTGHMVKIAEVMVKSRAIFGFVIPNSIKDFGAGMSGVRPGDQFMILGSGDVIFPLLMIASLVRVSLARSWIVFGFSLLGIFATHLIFINQKVRRPMAALPPIAVLTIAGYFISSLIK